MGRELGRGPRTAPKPGHPSSFILTLALSAEDTRAQWKQGSDLEDLLWRSGGCWEDATD